MNLRSYQEKALQIIKQHNKGIIVIPTGGGKTMIFMEDIKQRIESSSKNLTIVVVAPKILLATQLFSEFHSYFYNYSNILYTQVHSGEDGTTDSEMICSINHLTNQLKYHHLMFTTYKSLHRINEANIKIDVAIFDEAHHSVYESNFVGVAETSKMAKNSYFYTATPKHTSTKTTMSNSNVYGGTIISIPPKDLVENGYILPPLVKAYESSEFEDENIIRFLNEIEINNPKVLVAVPSSQKMMDLFTETEILNQLEDMNYNVFHITSKYGCILNNEKLSRNEFFERLNEIGNDDEQKLIIFHHSILSEGISINGFTHALLLRNLSVVDYVQTIGRILRLHRDDSAKIQSGVIKPGEYHRYKKPCGIIAFPSKDSRGNKIEQKLQSIVDTLFVRGEVLIA